MMTERQKARAFEALLGVVLLNFGVVGLVGWYGAAVVAGLWLICPSRYLRD
jgi:hypothetical protein